MNLGSKTYSSYHYLGCSCPTTYQKVSDLYYYYLAENLHGICTKMEEEVC